MFMGNDKESITKQDFYLEQNYPNPFNATTTIRYMVGGYNSTSQHVELSIYNLLGQKVVTLVSGTQPDGEYEVVWNAEGQPSGIYIYRLETSQGMMQARKLILMK
jgi:hypothetical protein